MALALESFQQIDECIYSNKSLGATKQLELMSCDCSRLEAAGPLCTEELGCVNRLTSIECYGDSHCKGRCTNRQFQNKEFASIEVFDAGAKGYGVRAKEPIKENQFIYEYIGEVIDKSRFEKRKVLYEKEGVEHFYFMMLQKDEFIDATKKGSVARFLNHSCNPNCAVNKWMVGPKLRMGIFALRSIQPGEELTFDYNADRFGDNVQQCLCGEPNCRGVLNGKTDAIDLIPRALWPILGLDTETVEEIREEIKANKVFKKKKELDSEIVALVPSTPIDDPEHINQIVTFLMQPQEEFLVGKVLARISTSQSQQIQGRLLKMHGYELFGTLLSQYNSNEEMVLEMLRVLESWPRVTRNKISSSKIEQVVQGLSKSDNEDIEKEAKKLLAEWSELEMAYRIPRQKREPDMAPPEGTKQMTEEDEEDQDPEDAEGSQQEDGNNSQSTRAPKKELRLPRGWSYAYQGDDIYYFNRELQLTQWERPKDPREIEREQKRIKEREEKRALERQKEFDRLKEQKEREAADLQRIIEAAGATDAANTPASVETPSAAAASSTPKKQLSKEEKLERQFTHILAAYVPKVVFKYEDRLDREHCKKHAKEIVKVLVEKEMRKGTKELDLNEAKKKKIKGFISDYIKKLINHKKSKEDQPARKKIKTT